MKMRKTAFMMSVVLMIGMLCGCVKQKPVTEEKIAPSDYESMMKQWKQSATDKPVVCWYTSEADKGWLESAAASFQEEYSIPVSLVYYDGMSLFEDMNQANQNASGPDLYIMGNDQIEFARTGGMLKENTAFDDAFWQEYYPEVAKRALTCKGKQYGYPVYFDTYCLVYDANLLENAPASIDDILNFLDAYEDTGSTKAVFRWDVGDPYINTMFLSAYADLFGENGDDYDAFQINGEQAVAAMQYFQSLSAYLWMNKGNISHDTVMNRIKDGTLVLGLCKSDILPTLYEMQAQSAPDSDNEKQQVQNEENVQEENAEAAQEETQNDENAQGENAETVQEEAQNGENEEDSDAQDKMPEENAERENAVAQETNYQVSYVPSMTAEMYSDIFSTTYGAFVNPYGNNEAAGDMFALYLSYAVQDRQFAGNGKLPVISQQDAFDSMQSVIYAQYLNSRPVPKVMVFGDYLTEGGITFDAIWNGQDAKEQLDRLQNVMEEKIKKMNE